MRGDRERVGGDHAAVEHVPRGLHVEPHVVREEPAERCQDAAVDLIDKRSPRMAQAMEDRRAASPARS